MPPKATQSSSQGGPKQTSLLGFFSKPTTTPSSGINRPRPPATPASATARVSSSTSKAGKSASTSKEAAEKRRQAIQAATQSSPTGNIKALASSDQQEISESSSSGKTLAAENGKARRPSSNGITNGTAQEKPQDKVDSDVFLGSSPLSAVDVLDDDEEQAVVEREASLDTGKEKTNGKGKTATKSDDEATVDIEMAIDEEVAEGLNEEGEDEDDQPIRSSVSTSSQLSTYVHHHRISLICIPGGKQARNSKRKITYIETDEEGSDDSYVPSPSIQHLQV